MTARVILELADEIAKGDYEDRGWMIDALERARDVLLVIGDPPVDIDRQAAFDAALARHEDTPLERGYRATPQSVGFFEAGFAAGEAFATQRPPSDAEVEAASRAYSGELVVGSGDGNDAMRAALEAARAAR